MSYGVEIWGWKEREGMERLEERYLKWIFGLDSKTPGYIVREEVKRNKLRERAGKRVGKRDGDLRKDWRREREAN